MKEYEQGWQHITAQLGCIVTAIKLFSNEDECIDFLEEIKDEQVFMVISGTVGQQLILLIYDIPQVKSFYVFYDERTNREVWMNEWTKVKGVFTQIESLCNSLKQDIKQCDHDLTPISILSTDDCTKKDLNQLEPSFMYSKILKEIFLDFEPNKDEKKEFVQFLREQYYYNQAQLNKIDQFERDYKSDSAIEWYTRECFIYEILNRALRTLDTDIILKMGFFLSDLHQQIEQSFNQQPIARIPFTVYRGQGMHVNKFEKLRQSIGGLLSFNNFLSTSMNKNVSLMFCPTSHPDPDIIPVFYEIEIDPTQKSTAFASLINMSQFDSEEEILFSMHTVFRIMNMEEIDKEYWQIKLVLTSDEDLNLKQLTQRIRQETFGSTGWDQLGKLLMVMENYDKAEEIYQIVLEEVPKDDEKGLALRYHQLGMVRNLKGDYAEALMFYEKALNIQEKSLSSYHLELTILYSNMGSLYLKMGEYSRALEFYEQTLTIYQKHLPSDHTDFATIYNNIGLLNKSMGNYSKALEFYKKSLEIKEKTPPLNHPGLAITYRNIGYIHNKLRECSKALEYYYKALSIQEKSLPPKHPGLATTYNDIATAHGNLEEYSKALEYYRKIILIEEHSLSPNHPDVALTYVNIGSVYDNIGDYLNALENYHKALSIQKKSLSSNHPDLATTYNNIAVAYENLEEYSKALEHYFKALLIQEKSFSPNHPEIAITYNNIGLVYETMEEYSKSLEFHQKSLKIKQQQLLADPLGLSTTYTNIGSVYNSMGEYTQALEYFQRTLEIYQKHLPSMHTDLATLYCNIGLVRCNMKEYSQALEFYQKSLLIYEKVALFDHKKLAITYNNIASMYYQMKEYSKAIEFYQKSLDLKQKSLPSNHPSLATTYSDIGTIYENIGEYSKALNCYERAVEIAQYSLPDNDDDFQLYQELLTKLRKKLLIKSIL